MTMTVFIRYQIDPFQRAAARLSNMRFVPQSEDAIGQSDEVIPQGGRTHGVSNASVRRFINIDW